MSCNADTDALSRPSRSPREFHGMLSSADCMHALFETIARVAKTKSTVLVRGETGTGKELVANALHACSGRAQQQFRAINCATLTPELLASELFGHVRGAFTGSVRDHDGLFAQADGGTVFLDEIAELPLRLQAQLLRVLQERSFVPVGGSKPQTVDIRLIAATNKALRTEVAEGRFREDLMYRIRVIPLFLPPLVERDRDVEALLWKFIDDFNALGLRKVERIAPNALRLILEYRWPGNIRELQNLVEYAFALGIGPLLTADELPPEFRGVAPGGRSVQGSEREIILAALVAQEGHKTAAAAQLGISRSTLWRKMKEFAL